MHEWIRNESSDTGVPWTRDYLRHAGSAGDESIVDELIISDKGLLVICESYKGFLWQGMKTYQFLMEAMQVWTKNPKESIRIVCRVNANASIDIAPLHETLGTGAWISTNKGIRWGKKLDALDTSSSLNPFLAPPAMQTRKRTRNGDATPPSAQ